MLGWLKAAVVFAVKMFAWTRQSSTPSLVDALPFAVGQLLPAVQRAIEYQHLDTQVKFDAWLDMFDQATGVDTAAIDFIGGLPADKEEKFFDHLIEAARIYGYHLIGMEGYVEHSSSPVQGKTGAAPNPGQAQSVTIEPSLQWVVSLHCKVGFEVNVFLGACKTRLPDLVPNIDYDASAGNQTIFSVDVLLMSSDSATAVSMASALLKHHFGDLIVMDVIAEPSEN